MSVQRTNPIVWLDMEMTGLDPETCVPLQVAVVLTGSDLEEIAVMEMEVWQPESRLEPMEPFVTKMHTDNGLLDRVRASDKSVGERIEYSSSDSPLEFESELLELEDEDESAEASEVPEATLCVCLE